MLSQIGDYDLLHKRLQEWGLWINKCVNSQANGYPSSSTTVRALQGSRSTAPIYPPDNSYAEEINNVVLQIQVRHALYANILQKEYCEAGNQEQKARRIGKSRRYYTDNLKAALAMVEGILMGIYGYKKNNTGKMD